MKKTSQEIVQISNEVAPVIEQANSLKITDEKTMEIATEFLSRLNIENDRIIEEKERVTKPLNEALKAERSRWAPVEKTLKMAIETVREKLGTYQMAVIKKQKEEESKIASRIGEGKGKISMETAVKKIGEIDIVKEKVSTNSGSVSFMTVYSVEILKVKEIPIEYMIPNESLILEKLKVGEIIPGTKLVEKLVPKNIRK